MGKIIGLAPGLTIVPEDTELEQLKVENETLKKDLTKLQESHVELLAAYEKLDKVKAAPVLDVPQAESKTEDKKADK